MRRILPVLIAPMALLAAGCAEGGQETVENLSECADPRLLKAQVGNTVFALPHTVDQPSASVADMQRQPEKLGIKRVDPSFHRKDPTIRMSCNDRDTPVANFESEFGSRLTLGPGEYVLVDVMRLGEFDEEYIAEVSEISDVRFVGVEEGAKIGELKTAVYTFRFGDRTAQTDCQILDFDVETPGKAPSKMEYAVQCVPPINFRHNDVMIGVSRSYKVRGDMSASAVIPPEQWPALWKEAIDIFLSFEVKQKDDASATAEAPPP